MNRVAKAFNAAAHAYEQYACQQSDIGQYLLGMASLPACEHVLDIGCGPGRLASHRPDLSVTGIDLAPAMCAQACPRQHHSLVGDAHVLPLAEESFVYAHSSLCWQWLSDPAQAAQEVWRVLKPGGQFLWAGYVQGTLHELARAYAQVGRASPLLNFRSLDEEVGYLRATGFTIELAEQESRRMEHAQAVDCLRYLKQIGASAPTQASFDGMMTPSQLMVLTRAYGAPISTWQVGYIIARKAS